jgi:hypothetical protein
MQMSTPILFKTVPQRDYLNFWPNQTFEPQRVARFLELSKTDIAKVAGVASTSVRFDHKIPRDVLDRFMEIANICGLVAQFFQGDAIKTSLWFKTKNPLLGNLSPRDMIRYGRYEKLRRFVMDALEHNAAADIADDRTAKGMSGDAPAATQ